MKEVVQCSWEVGDEAVDIVIRYHRVDLKDRITPVIECVRVEFVGQEVVEHCHVQRVCQADR